MNYQLARGAGKRAPVKLLQRLDLARARFAAPFLKSGSSRPRRSSTNFQCVSGERIDQRLLGIGW